MLKRQSKAITRNRVHASRSIANQCNISGTYATKRTHISDRSSLSAADFRTREIPSQLRQLREGILKRSVGQSLAHHHDANFFTPNWRHVRLRVFAPIN